MAALLCEAICLSNYVLESKSPPLRYRFIFEGFDWTLTKKLFLVPSSTCVCIILDLYSSRMVSLYSIALHYSSTCAGILREGSGITT